VQPATPEPAEYDDENPENKRDALLPARERRVQDVAAVELRDGQEVQHGHEHAKPTRERDGMDEQCGCRPVGKHAEQQSDERVTEDSRVVVDTEQQAGCWSMPRERVTQDE